MLIRRNKIKRPAFTLIEVLISVAVLFVVGSAVVNLSNSIIQGTAATTDSTVINLWASEGLELTAKYRDERTLSLASHSTGSNPEWFYGATAASDRGYGWYRLVQQGDTWRLDPILGLKNTLTLSNVADLTSLSTQAEKKSIENAEAYRLICIEPFHAYAIGVADKIQCNTADENGTKLAPLDYTASLDNSCKPNDDYCQVVYNSINLNNAGSKRYVPPGNAAKVSSVIVWPYQGRMKKATMTTLLTNWRSIDF